MRKTMKKLLTLVLAGMMTAGCVISAGAAVISDLQGNPIHVILPDKLEDIPYIENAEHFISIFAKCPECGKSCYKIPFKFGEYVYHAYYCADHDRVEPSFSIEKPKPEFTYTIRTQTTAGGSITLDCNDPIRFGDSRTVYITPDYGYICTGVYVNGISQGVKEKLELKNICSNYRILATFKAVNQNHINIITTTVTGSGTVNAALNGQSFMDITSIGAKYGDVLTLSFRPAKGNYIIENVKINGVDMGPIQTHTFQKLYYDVQVSVSYKWKNPFKDIAADHLEAVEYVYENDIMASPNQHINTDQFLGTAKVSLRVLSAYLAELADTENVLDNIKERENWAKENGIISDSDKLGAFITMKEAADVVEKFIRVLEKDSELTFTALKNISGGKDIAKAIGYVTDTTYNNTSITRYDVAEICYGIAKLSVE